MSDKPPVNQKQEPSSTRPQNQSLTRRYEAARDRSKATRSAAYARFRKAVRKDLEPVTSRWRTFRGKIEDNRKWAYPLIGLILITIAALLPFLGDWFSIPIWLQRATNGSVLARTALFVLFALGLNVVVGFAGLLDLGYVAFWAIGAYTAGIATGAHAYLEGGSVGPEPTWHMWMWAILLLALVVATLAGLLLGSPTLRLRGDYLAIVTLGFGEIIRIVANNLDHVTGGPRGIRNIPHPEIHVGGLNVVWGTLIDTKYYWLLLGLVVLWIVAIRMLDNSRIGRAWVAIREDEVAAASMGVNIVRMKLAAFAIGACTAGVGGVIYAEQINFISPPTFNIQQSILILAMVVIGGMGSIGGAIVGASAVVLIPEVFKSLDDYRFFAFGFAIVLMMIFRPQGLLPSKRRKAELVGASQDQQLYEAAGGSG
ncbi:MAG: branched-chain amino acid transport system permease protein [Actinomycetota bacterium]|jgi:branched-chain amino acid transport system permease protein|nr:branched-chain amino acid transport system permease protein [Actinomycetota bacterium]